MSLIAGIFEVIKNYIIDNPFATVIISNIKWVGFFRAVQDADPNLRCNAHRETVNSEFFF
jgi:hypothetical protein